MAIPTFQDVLTPVLENLSSGLVKTRREVIDEVMPTLGLTEDELAETLKTGGNRVSSRISWAMEHLAQAKAIERPQRGQVRITDRGLKLLKDSSGSISVKDLKQFAELLDWYARSKGDKSTAAVDSTALNGAESVIATPVEEIENALNALEAVVAGELLDRLQKSPFTFFEVVVLKLLIAMGYGASEAHFEHLGGPGDEGVDGVIHLDELGLEKVFVQAKRYADNHIVGPGEVRGFAGALIGKNAMKGVFVTTSRFTKDAVDYAEKLAPQRVILIDGQRLAELLLQFGVGVVPTRKFEVFEIDENFFVDE